MAKVAQSPVGLISLNRWRTEALELRAEMDNWENQSESYDLIRRVCNRCLRLTQLMIDEELLQRSKSNGVD